ncbi:hypothetical protein AR457_39905 [Streptomyces agglomeratus]|uniref:hypothetical protein n=1 Tax=Streptomyces agglomeratus TaxID=285458 RepID=UPI0008524B50|nr:hypothetical protein [Streptomyces agglomeratus]OEJ21860.1 hypothetical protein AR457_38585 [Streptomyces agglomeratus]OEJ22061.1 hypothetical protein AR457_39905 [Streptomyces agglomeratus]OEJ36898.1 hypothetical protein BGK70_00560 [Streptomyces agglomeratus]
MSPDERELLRLIAEADKPVAMSDFFHTIHPANFDSNVPEDDPARLVWTERQMGLYGASIALWEAELVRVVKPADGEHPDLVEATPAGRAALA